jgi:hypothetical protein
MKQHEAGHDNREVEPRSPGERSEIRGTRPAYRYGS